MPFYPRVLYLDIYHLEVSRRSSVLPRIQVLLGRKCLLSKPYVLPVALWFLGTRQRESRKDIL